MHNFSHVLLLFLATNVVLSAPYDEYVGDGFDDRQDCKNAPNDDFLTYNKNTANPFIVNRKLWRNKVANNNFPEDENEGAVNQNDEVDLYPGGNSLSVGQSWNSQLRPLPKSRPNCKFPTYARGDQCGLDGYSLKCALRNPCLANPGVDFLGVIGNPYKYVQCNAFGYAICQSCGPGLMWNPRIEGCVWQPRKVVGRKNAGDDSTLGYGFVPFE